MLLELTIRQFAIIEELKVNFKEGLNIITGETGAGKSIIIDAIQLISGGRGSIEFIRNNAEKAEIEALFDLDLNHEAFSVLNSLGIAGAEDGLIILKRELLRNGKSICRINGELVTLAVLKELGQFLIQLHSQNQHQNLMNQDKQLLLLDAYGNKYIENIKTVYQQVFSHYQSLNKELKMLRENEKEAAQRIDLLKYQIDEIEKAKLRPNEDEELQEARDKIRNSEKITNNLHNAYNLLYSDRGINEQLFHVVSLLEQISSYDKNIALIHEQIIQAYYQIEDATNQLNSHVNELDFDPNQINIIEERFSLIYHLKRKYGDSVDAIIEYLSTIEAELTSLSNREERLDNLEKELNKATQELINNALQLSNERKKYALDLSGKIEQELKDLQMVNAKFKVEIEYIEEKNGIELNGNSYHISNMGLDKVNFLISPNPGEPLKPLNKIASGGELSRIMLAIQTILANKDDVPTIIFDEIDTGVSGRAAQAIAEKLAYVARDKQIFVVTHLPQVASMADYHYLIQKKIKDQTTYTEIELLDEEKRIEELARMLGGVEVTDLTKKHAKEMIEKAIPLKILNK